MQSHECIARLTFGMRWRRTTLREWEWNPALSDYNPANVIDVILNTEFTTLDERLRIVAAAWTPITRAVGIRSFTAVATPAISPPLLTGTSTVKASGSGPVRRSR